jgi:hypothetical protein
MPKRAANAFKSSRRFASTCATTVGGKTGTAVGDCCGNGREPSGVGGVVNVDKMNSCAKASGQIRAGANGLDRHLREIDRHENVSDARLFHE